MRIVTGFVFVFVFVLLWDFLFQFGFYLGQVGCCFVCLGLGKLKCWVALRLFCFGERVLIQSSLEFPFFDLLA